jgi:uncharacterized membrane protein HdeD (DUF308 family)
MVAPGTFFVYTDSVGNRESIYQQGCWEAMMFKKDYFGWISILVGALLLVGGVFLFANPVRTLYVAGVLIGILAILRGILLITGHQKHAQLSRLRAQGRLILGIVLVVIGAVFLIRPAFASAAFLYIAAVWFILEAIHHFVHMGRFRLLSPPLFIANLILNVLLLAGAVLILISPWFLLFSSAFLLGLALLFNGATLVLLGALSLVQKDRGPGV